MADHGLRVAVVGAGGHCSQSILPSLRATGFDLRAVCDLDESRAARAAARFGAPAVHTDLGVLLKEEDVDLVAVVGPPSLHVEAGLQALAAGRHVFVEKPPGLTVADAVRLRDAAAAADRRLMVGFMKRHARAYRIVREAMATPEFGRPTMLRLNYSHWRYAPLRDHLAFMSIHALDLARFFLGDVVGGAVRKRELDGQAVVVLTLEHESGAASVLTLSALEPRVQETLEIAGESTLISVQDLGRVEVQHRAPEFVDAIDTDASLGAFWRPDLSAPLAANDTLALQGYLGQFRHLADALTSGQQPSAGIEDGIAALRLVDAVVAAPDGVSLLPPDALRP